MWLWYLIKNYNMRLSSSIPSNMNLKRECKRVYIIFTFYQRISISILQRCDYADIVITLGNTGIGTWQGFSFKLSPGRHRNKAKNSQLHSWNYLLTNGLTAPSLGMHSTLQVSLLSFSNFIISFSSLVVFDAKCESYKLKVRCAFWRTGLFWLWWKLYSLWWGKEQTWNQYLLRYWT